jgi:hypothetical protein
MLNKKIYIGDSVYAEWNGHFIILTTENGLPYDPTNKIMLDGDVITALEIFVQSVRQHIRDHFEKRNEEVKND